ncbi:MULTISPECIES: ABC transporter ATP-binding protein [Actinomadura]|uniref:ATP-binding cassette domain-containing protein n=1 Tax=Actinomadura yumaensis TaxID=111807 RepID=A0ABW2CCN7_9ACTN|nr:ATP-binding cassette domain-containing protein [Actinomadura sp. J1-007]MWK33848.1 ATP-binding cassette domain-containing protein [Actinomadura sp. J1-007]
MDAEQTGPEEGTGAGAAEVRGEEPPPVVEADDLGVRTRRGWVYRGVTLRASAGTLVAVAGPGGSGRTSLLLTVAGRMRPTSGALRVCGLDLPEGAARVRGRAAVARAGGAAELEPELRVADHVRERALTLPGTARSREARESFGGAWKSFGAACEVVGLDVPGRRRVRDLSPGDATRLALALAVMERPDVLVLDDLDAGSDGAGQHALWSSARRAADLGAAVVASTTEPSPAGGLADVLLTLGEH